MILKREIFFDETWLIKNGKINMGQPLIKIIFILGNFELIIWKISSVWPNLLLKLVFYSQRVRLWLVHLYGCLGKYKLQWNDKNDQIIIF